MTKLTTRQIFTRNLSRTHPQGMKQTIIWLHDIRSLHNVGSVFRSADAFGCNEIILSGHTPSPPRAEISKTALGAEEYIPWRYFENTDKIIDELKSSGYDIIGIEQTDASKNLLDFKPICNKICLLFGNEITGINDKLIKTTDFIIEIPQFGKKHSLNVSVAAGIVLFALLSAFCKSTH